MHYLGDTILFLLALNKLKTSIPYYVIIHNFNNTV